MSTIINFGVIPKTFFMLILLLVLGQNTSFAQNNPEKTEHSKKEKKPKKEKKSKKPKNTMDTISINPLRSSDYTIKVGQNLSYSYVEHASVGISGEYFIENSKVLELKDKVRTYKNNNGLPGGDEASIVLLFTGKEKGTTTLTVKKMFRGSVEDEYKFNITVE
jgi:hypothetical protein